MGRSGQPNPVNISHVSRALSDTRYNDLVSSSGFNAAAIVRADRGSEGDLDYSEFVDMRGAQGRPVPNRRVGHNLFWNLSAKIFDLKVALQERDGDAEPEPNVDSDRVTSGCSCLHANSNPFEQANFLLHAILTSVGVRRR